MSGTSPSSLRGAGRPIAVGSPPAVRLEVRHADGPATTYEFQQESILIGTVAGCDLRLPGSELPPLLCILTLRPEGLHLRKLAPAQPLLINGQPRSDGPLAPDDLLGLARFTLRVSLDAQPQIGPVPQPSFDGQRKLLEEGIRKLKEAEQQFQEDRRDWEEDAERQAESLAVRSRHVLDREKALASGHAELERQRLESLTTRAALEQRDAELRKREEEQVQQQEDLSALKEKLHLLRDELHHQYRKRRDALAMLREAVDNAARKVQEEKRALAADAGQRRQERETLTVDAARLKNDQTALAVQQQAVATRLQEVDRQETDLTAAKQQFAEEQQRFRESQAQHREDLARLDRLQAAIEARQAELEKQSKELDEQSAQLQQAVESIRQRAQAVADGQAQFRAAETAIAQKREEVEAAARRWTERHGVLETQQAVLASLRNRVERLQADLLQREHQLTEQRLRQEESETALREAGRQVQQQQTELRREREQWTEERRQIEERCSQLEAVVAHFRSLQESFEATEKDLTERRTATETQEKALAEKSAKYRLHAQKLHVFRRRLLAARQALREREGSIVQTDGAREVLQEQLQRRSELLAEREKQLADLQRQTQEAADAMQLRQAELDAKHVALAEATANHRQESERRLADLAQRETVLQQQTEQLQAAAATLQVSRQDVQRELEQLETLRRESGTAAEQTRQEAAKLREGLPELVRQAQTALERLGKSREQLREHLREVHAYAQQCRVEAETAHKDLASQAESVREAQTLLARGQDEHRHAVGAFRQFLSEWQGQLAELRQSLQQGESSLQQREAKLAEQAQHIEQTANQLAERAELLEGQERDVAQRREELHRHLADMQQWYRQKLRELAERRLLHPQTLLEAAESGPAVLPIRGEPAPGDKQFADLLTSMNLIDADTLRALLDEAGKQGKSLRDALLDGDYLTSFQVEMIEADRLEALFQGPLRIVDRLRMTPLETIYRVFDPRSNEELLLRHLSPGASAEKQAEFRERFTKACGIHHPHLAATREVCEMSGSPAALQEWVVGVPSGEWAAFAAVSAVWLRLMSQIAAGLRTAHEAGLDHGHLHAGRLLLTEQGELKICGLGEPLWLFPEMDQSPPLTGPAADLLALGKIAETWLNAGPRGRWKRPASDALHAALARLVALDEGTRHPSAAALLIHLEYLQSQTPDDNGAWDRLLAFVRERLRPADGEEKRQSA